MILTASLAILTAASSSVIPTCRQGSYYVDGCSAAPSGTPQMPHLLDLSSSTNGLNHNLASRPPWNAAGVDYYVGIDRSLYPTNASLKDAGVSANLPSCATISSNTVSVTANNCTLDGYDFSTSNGLELSIGAHSGVIVSNSLFKVGPNALTPIAATGSFAGMLAIKNNEFQGNNTNITDHGGGLIYVNTGSSSTLYVQYNYFNQPHGDAIQIDGSGVNFHYIDYNYILAEWSEPHADWVQWTANVDGGTVSFNTIYFPTGTGSGITGEIGCGAQLGRTDSNIVAQNNVVFGQSGGTRPTYAFFANADGSSTLNNFVLNNSYWDSAAIGALFYTHKVGSGFNYGTNTTVTNLFNMFAGSYSGQPSGTSSYINPTDVTSAAASPSSGTVMTGNPVTITLTMSLPYTVTGTPMLSLNNGGTATYVAGSGTNTLTFSYMVTASNSNVSALAISQVNLPNGARVFDAVGNNANLSGALKAFPGLRVYIR
jgi:hypothetical protein